MARLRVTASGVVGDGDRVKERREALGMPKSALAELAGVDRATLAAVENGQGFRQASLKKIERALDDFEEEAGYNAPPMSDTAPPPIVVVRLTNPSGWQVVVEGPVTNRDEIEETAQRLIRGLPAE